MTTHEDLVKAIAVTAELCGRTFTPEAAAVFVDDLAGFDPSAVFGALKRCRREVRGVLTVQDVVSRLDDGRPGVEEAWAMLPQSEATSVVWTEEMREAFGVAMPLIGARDKVAARMAFKEAYVARVNAARDRREPPTWCVSLGHDPGGRAAALVEAVSMQRLTLAQARNYVPTLNAPVAQDGDVLRLTADALRLPS